MNSKETLEEAAENFFNNTRFRNYKTFFCEGAKWQQERSYSKEELITAFEAGHDSARLHGSYKSNGTYQEDLNKFLKNFEK